MPGRKRKERCKEKAKTLLFVRTRIGSAELARSLADLGFRSRALNGEMSHRERTQTFADFKSGAVQYLAATDVAARGLDVQDISRVIQVDLPNNADVFTHRCGRTGRAGRTGQNIVLISPKGRYSLERLAKGARVKVRYETVPQREQILAAAEQRVVERAQSPVPPLPEQLELADRLLDGFPAREVLARLLAHMDLNGVCEPRDVRSPEGGKKKRKKDRDRDRGDRDRGDRGRDRFSDNRSDDRGDRPRRPRKDSGDFVKFQVSWGAQRGADPRRLLALVCRRGDLSRDDVGAIRVAPRSSMIEIARGRASDFESIVKRPDPRDPHVHFRRWQDDGPPRREGGGQRRDNKPFRGGRKPPRRKD